MSNDQSNESVAENNQPEVSSNSGYFSSWSWGGFMFDAPFLVAVKEYKYLLLYLLMIVPLVNIFALIGIKIFLGIKGRQMAKESSFFDSDDEVKGFLKGFDWAGKVFFFVGLAVFVLAFVATAIFGAAMADLAPFEVYMNNMPQ